MKATHKVKDTAYARLPVALQKPIDRCDCTYCKAHPHNKPMWDTLAFRADGEGLTWTVHAPEFWAR